MVELELLYEDGRRSQGAYPLPLTIGRGEGCGLRLKSWRVAKQHARLVARGGLLFLEDLGSLAGTFVNGRRVVQQGALSIGDELIIGPCRMHILRLPAVDQAVCAGGRLVGSAQGAAAEPPLFAPSAPSRQSTHPPSQAPGLPSGPEPVPADALSLPADSCPGPADFMPGPAGPPLPPAERDTIRTAPAAQTPASPHATPPSDPAGPQRATFAHHRRRLHKALVEALDLRRRDILELTDEALRSEAAEVLSAILAQDGQLPPGLNRNEMLRQVVDEAVGLGPLEPLLADRGVSEIMVNAHEDIYVERAGRLLRHPAGFSSEQAVVAVIDRIVAPLGRRVDESSPMVDARLKDGSRVNAVIPPIALRGACLTIRKFPERRLDMNDLLEAGSLDRHMSAFLAACVAARKSLLVSGGTGSGKTTLLNVLSNCIPAGERVITIEDAAELRLNHAHLVALESRPPNAEGKGRVDIRDLVRNALRMRPDRIIVGECRGAEAFDMLSAMNTGHEGSLTTLHANSPRDALARLETMILMAGMDLPLAAVREHIASAIDVIVQQARLSSGRRLITAIVEVTGMEAGRIQTQELFRYRHGAEPWFEGCGIPPECFAGQEDLVPLAWLTQTTALKPDEALRAWQS